VTDNPGKRSGGDRAEDSNGKRSSRTGRNLPAAVASGVVLAAIVIASLFTYKWLFGVVVIIALGVAMREMVQAFASRDIKIARVPTYLAVVLLPTVAYLAGPIWQLVATGAVLLLAMLWRIRRGVDGYVRDITASFFVIAYLPFMAGFLMLTLAADDGPWRVVVFILLTISNDIGGYFAGIFYGKHPIAASISPKKSWEGFAGSVLMQGVVGALSFMFLLGAPWWQGVIAGLVLSVTATGGDFAESAIKRDLGIKDMGSFLPGHGGMMDRFDSLIPNAFASWAIFTVFLGASFTGAGL
jgi:phosphatidate cytidylyltransferase